MVGMEERVVDIKVDDMRSIAAGKGCLQYVRSVRVYAA